MGDDKNTNNAVEWTPGSQQLSVDFTSGGIYQITVKTGNPACGIDSATTWVQPELTNVNLLSINQTVAMMQTPELIEGDSPKGGSGDYTFTWESSPDNTSWETIPGAKSVNYQPLPLSTTAYFRRRVFSGKCFAISTSISIAVVNNSVNTFSPNGDGINDFWYIAIPSEDQSVHVRVFNRYGYVVYESKGTFLPWSGEYKGSKVATGTFYYIVTYNDGKSQKSGSLTLIY